MALNFDTINLVDFVVKQGNGVKGLIDSGLSKVPDVYIQPIDRRISKTNNIDAAKIVSLPLIDISQLDGPEHDQVEKALVKAAETVGFFHVVNHGLTIQVIEELKDATRQFFNLPPDKKLVYQKGITSSSLVVYGTSIEQEWRDYLIMIYNSDDDAYKYWPDQCK
ncbi:Feruloyl coa ortho-hydroxylase [Thalictrum thalictroides]|uniref:Feruloyl coa ortho-hydroxylase n=1 Tax=Thalictrum thalictroides TaxID=46969 RepID=A0A7J6WSJ9_THATH|nr:Feruloyl coa ortho-hydroxylase [Thalictrum thalictroides]